MQRLAPNGSGRARLGNLGGRPHPRVPDLRRSRPPDWLTQRWDGARVRVSAHRRLIAAALAGLAVLLAWPSLGHTSGGSEVLVAAHDLQAGRRLTDQDVRAARLPTVAVPAHALTPGMPVNGRAPAGPVRSGEALTDVRLLGPALLDELSRQDGRALVAAPVRIADAAAVGLLQAGDTVDVLAAGSSPGESGPVADADSPGVGAAGPARIVAAGARVLAVPPAETTDPTGGALVVVAVPSATAADVASAAGTSRLSVTVHPAPATATTSPGQPSEQIP